MNIGRTIKPDATSKVKEIFASRFVKNVKRDKMLLLMLSPVLIYYIIFQYIPMYGIIIAFKEYLPGKGMFSGTWVGFTYFDMFFQSVYFFRTLKNTLVLSLYGLLFGFPIYIIFALLLNELRNGVFKRIVQTISYLPHFISIAVVVGMLVNFFSVTDGVVNIILRNLGMQPASFMTDSKYFRFLYIGSGIWQEFGWNSIIYLAALASINPILYEAAKIDGASRFKQMIYITIPGILPTIIIMLLLSLGNLLFAEYQKIILMYNPGNYDVSDVIATYTYRRGILNSDYSYGTAVGLFNATVNMVLLVIFNKISKKVSDISLW
jgi:putative aldouronate transport system permease protein